MDCLYASNYYLLVSVTIHAMGNSLRIDGLEIYGQVVLINDPDNGTLCFGALPFDV